MLSRCTRHEYYNGQDKHSLKQGSVKNPRAKNRKARKYLGDIRVVEVVLEGIKEITVQGLNISNGITKIVDGISVDIHIHSSRDARIVHLPDKHREGFHAAAENLNHKKQKHHGNMTSRQQKP